MLSDDSIRTHMSDGLQQVLEAMAFAEVSEVPADGEFPEVGYPVYFSRIQIDAPDVDATMELAVSKDLAEMLADNMCLEFEDEASKATAMTDMMAELTNTVTGNFMLTLEREIGQFNISVPENGIGELAWPKDAVICRYLVDDEFPVAMTFSRS